MKLALCLFKYFPYGGLQRDFLRIGKVCRSRGHTIHVYTMKWDGEIPEGFKILFIPVKGLTNHQLCWNFSKQVADRLHEQQHDIVIGFNKMHGLDVYFAADPCYKAKVMEEKGALYRIGSRYRSYLALEKAVFDPSSHARILLIAEAEKAKYINYYNTPEERFYNLPPGISEDRIITGDVGKIRKAVRGELGMTDDEIFLLMVGSGFKTKGLDRSLAALSSLPDEIRARAKLFVIGEGNINPFKTLARRLKVHDRLFFLGGRNDVPRFMASADLFLHPAYSENTGTVLIEAMAAGIPILAADICGYAYHVIRAGAGLLIPSPFQQRAFNELLIKMLTSPDREAWKRKGPEYVKENDFVSMPERAADLIESFGSKGSKQ